MKAFTLIDILVGMILSAIVISLGVEGIQYTNHSFLKNRAFQQNRMNESNMIRYFIYDAELADSIIRNEDQLSFYSKTGKIDWLFKESETFRKNEKIDSKATIKTTTNEVGMVDQFTFSFDKEYEFIYKKNYHSLKLNKIGH